MTILLYYCKKKIFVFKRNTLTLVILESTFKLLFILYELVIYLKKIQKKSQYFSLYIIFQFGKVNFDNITFEIFEKRQSNR